jgi:hypothetical protein
VKWYRHEFTKTLFWIQGLKSEWEFYVGSIKRDQQLARGFRSERDVLKVECLAMGVRFADEPLHEPLFALET